MNTFNLKMKSLRPLSIGAMAFILTTNAISATSPINIMPVDCPKVCQSKHTYCTEQEVDSNADTLTCQQNYDACLAECK